MSARLAFACLALLLAIGALGWWTLGRTSWSAIDAEITAEHPDLRRLDDATLAGWLGDPTRPRPALIDARSPEEYAVSHLPGAITPEAVERLDHRRPVVTYCSVGLRSSDLAERMRRLGFAEVSDLRGGIFAWANAGRPLERDGAPARVVHPYGRRWGRLLKPDLRASSPGRP